MPKSKSKRKRTQPPPKANPKTSPLWVGVLIAVLLGVGVIIVITNYVAPYPGGTANWRMFYGLGLMAAALMVATQWH